VHQKTYIRSILTLYIVLIAAATGKDRLLLCSGFLFSCLVRLFEVTRGDSLASCTVEERAVIVKNFSNTDVEKSTIPSPFRNMFSFPTLFFAVHVTFDLYVLMDSKHHSTTTITISTTSIPFAYSP
jgi:hypothetical protein